MRRLRLQDGTPPTLLAVAPGPGMLVAHSWADLGLHVFNVNGEHLVSAAGNERLSALAVTTSGHFLLTGGLRGVVSLHWLHSLEVSHAQTSCASSAHLQCQCCVCHIFSLQPRILRACSWCSPCIALRIATAGHGSSP